VDLFLSSGSSSESSASIADFSHSEFDDDFCITTSAYTGDDVASRVSLRKYCTVKAF